MTPDVLREGLRWLWWLLIYFLTVYLGILAYARMPRPWRWIAVAAVVYVCWHDSLSRRAPPPVP